MILPRQIHIFLLKMRDRPMEFIRELGFLSLNSRDDFAVLKKFFEKEEFTEDYLKAQLDLTEIMLPKVTAKEVWTLYSAARNDHDLRRAAMFLKLIRYSYSSGCKSFACQPFSLRTLFALVQDFAKRCENVIIENQDFEILIKHYDRPTTFTYCDPPYFTSEYVYDCGFTWEDHLRLYHALACMKGKFLLSYNDCPEIRELYMCPTASARESRQTTARGTNTILRTTTLQSSTQAPLQESKRKSQGAPASPRSSKKAQKPS